MVSKKYERSTSSYLKKWKYITTGLWIALVSVSLAWNWIATGKTLKAMAKIEADSMFNKDIVYRKWVSLHGGVYVPVTDKTPPSPYLSHLPERDIITPSGKKLTLVNPAYMTRQVNDIAREQFGVWTHITSLRPIRPENRPDIWEENALHSFENGAEEAVSIETMYGKSYFRLMHPLYTERHCLRCHFTQGYKVGSIIGGISVSVPFEPFKRATEKQQINLILAHLLLGLAGMIAIRKGFSLFGQYTTAIEEREEQLRTLINATPDIICFKDGNGRWLEANASDLKLFALEDVDYRGKRDSELAEYTNPIYHQAFLTCEKTDEEAWQKKGISRGEEIIPMPDGKKRVFDIIKVPIFESNGDRKGLVVLGRDITDRKDLEDALHAALRFQSLVINIATEFINVPLENFDEYVDRSLSMVGELLQVDRSYLFRYDFDKGTMTNTHEWVANGISSVKDDLQELPLDSYPEWVRSHKEGKLIHIPSVADLPEGQLKDVLMAQEIQSLCTFPLMIDDQCLGFVGFDAVRKQKEWTGDEISILKLLAQLYTNMEKFRQTEYEKANLQAQLQQAQKLESVGRLAGGVAHDLNNLLTPILGYSELLLHKFEEKDPRKKSVEQIYMSGLRARDIVHQLLAFSRKQTIEVKPLDINEVLKGIEKLIRRTLREDITIEMSLAPDLPPIMGDKGQLEQVVLNLAVNAQDAMPEGGLLLVETCVTELDYSYAKSHQGVKPGKYVMLSVSDSGFGMDRETCEHIFEPFFTTKGKEKGTGLGLAMVYGIVKQHGGNIWVYTEQGKGTTFKIYMPVAQDTHIMDEDAYMTDPGDSLRGNETILLVEDEREVQGLVKAILEDLGYTVIVADNGKEVMDILDQHKENIDLLLTDVIMPGLNGKELFSKVSEKHPGLKVLYMSGYTQDVIAHRGILKKETAFIQKPFTVKTLASKIREIIDKEENKTKA